MDNGEKLMFAIFSCMSSVALLFLCYLACKNCAILWCLYMVLMHMYTLSSICTYVSINHSLIFLYHICFKILFVCHLSFFAYNYVFLCSFCSSLLNSYMLVGNILF